MQKIAMTPPEHPTNEFGSNYSDWKGWGGQSFGTLTKHQAALFRRELSRIRKESALRSANVLELGFGNGTFLRFCRENNIKITGTEVSESLISIARSQGYNAIHAVDLQHLPERSFDLIVGFDVLEHIPSTEIEQFLRVISSKLADDGLILLRFPNADTWLGNQNFYGDPTHVVPIGNLKIDYFCKRCQLKLKHYWPEVRLGFDGGLLKGAHRLLAGPIISFLGFMIKILYFPRSRMVFTTANVVAIIEKDVN